MSDLTDQPDWLHLKPYGYAPGSYQSRCMHCTNIVAELDKRAVSCRPCAAKVHAIGGLRDELDRQRVTIKMLQDDRNAAQKLPSDTTQELGRVEAERDALRERVAGLATILDLLRTDGRGLKYLYVQSRSGSMVHVGPAIDAALKGGCHD